MNLDRVAYLYTDCHLCYSCSLSAMLLHLGTSNTSAWPQGTWLGLTLRPSSTPAQLGASAGASHGPPPQPLVSLRSVPTSVERSARLRRSAAMVLSHWATSGSRTNDHTIGPFYEDLEVGDQWTITNDHYPSWKRCLAWS